MRFLRPDMASWLLMAPLAVCAWILHVQAKRQFRRRASIARYLPPLSRLSTWRRDAIALAASLAAIVFLVAALCRPQVSVERRLPAYEKADLILVLDRSVSMRAEDVQPSRFTRAVQEIKAFLADKPETLDRVALVGFAGTSIVLSPLTRDMDTLTFYLDWLDEDLEPRFGTDIGNALANARALASRTPDGTRTIFLVVSDGDDQGPSLDAERTALRQSHGRVYTIGIGSERDAAIPLTDARDHTRTVLEDAQGQPVTTRFNEATLRRIATLTDGRFIRSITGGEVAPALRQAVRREGSVIGWTSKTDYRDVHRVCLAAAAVATIILLRAL